MEVLSNQLLQNPTATAKLLHLAFSINKADASFPSPLLLKLEKCRKLFIFLKHTFSANCETAQRVLNIHILCKCNMYVSVSIYLNIFCVTFSTIFDRDAG